MKALTKAILLGAGIATAAAPNAVKADQQTTVTRHVIREEEEEEKTKREGRFVTKRQFSIGSVPIVEEYYGNPPGLSPKEYGIRYGNGKSRKRKSNRLHKRSKFKQWHS